MPFEASRGLPRKIAVIGGGISGMGAAHLLAQDHRVVLFESEHRLGGHARTRMAGPYGTDPVDTGFIVFNYANYPHLTKLFEDLDVPVVESDMSFGASIDGGRVEYGLASLGALFAQRRNLARPQFLRMVRDLFHFNANALDASRDPSLTIGQLMDKLGMGDWFRNYYLLPISGAIWSTPVQKIMEFPAYAMMTFFENHALLHHTGQHQWFTVEGGSVAYVSRLANAMEKQGVDIRLSAPVAGVRRGPQGVEVRAQDGEWELFDEIVMATHSDDTLSMLSDATPQERDVLSNIRYQPNTAILHSDPSIMPKRRQVWSSWVYTEATGQQKDRIDLTYWMNSLQPWLRGGTDYFVTLNTTHPIREDLIWDQATFRHPVYDHAALEAQRKAVVMNGSNRTWFCGAWMKNGFHEDGLSSAVDVVTALNAVEGMKLAAE
ncbi:NAD(P)/FAD-dependent oxidoreductase [Marivivens marinus]|uniref:NAD(P)/FAD-dependent oxidoreductase n=1 Tax=Marivivens marinus TaxID=3110173 RepID=UPI003B84795D